MIKIFVAAAMLATAFTTAGSARADGYVSPQEERFGDAAAGAVCRYIDNAGVTAATMTEAVRIIYINTPAHMDMGDAVDIINYAVYNYCPEHWDKLVAFGEGART